MITDSPFALQQYPVRYNTIRVNELDIFYREAGPQNASTILLLHGFSTSSNMFRNLIPRLATSWRPTIPASAKASSRSGAGADRTEWQRVRRGPSRVLGPD